MKAVFFSILVLFLGTMIPVISLSASGTRAKKEMPLRIYDTPLFMMGVEAGWNYRLLTGASGSSSESSLSSNHYLALCGDMAISSVSSVQLHLSYESNTKTNVGIFRDIMSDPVKQVKPELSEQIYSEGGRLYNMQLFTVCVQSSVNKTQGLELCIGPLYQLCYLENKPVDKHLAMVYNRAAETKQSVHTRLGVEGSIGYILPFSQVPKVGARVGIQYFSSPLFNEEQYTLLHGTDQVHIRLGVNFWFDM